MIIHRKSTHAEVAEGLHAELAIVEQLVGSGGNVEGWKGGRREMWHPLIVDIYGYIFGIVEKKTLTNEQLMSKAMYNVYCTWLPAVKRIKKLISHLIVTYL